MLLTEEIVIDYVDTSHNRPVRSTVRPGYLKELLPEHAPEDGEKWEEIQKDIESKVMPGMNHWYLPITTPRSKFFVSIGKTIIMISILGIPQNSWLGFLHRLHTQA